MEFEYENPKVEKHFEDFDLIRKKTDGVFTKLLKKRCDQLRAFVTFSDLLQSRIGNPHSLKGSRKGLYAVNVDKNKRLIVQPVSDDLSPESLKKCKKVVIKGVEDYHGSKVTSYIP